MRNTVIGFYDKFGYDVNLIDNNGQIIETLYSASQVVADGLPESTIINYCIQTAREIAQGQGLIYSGSQDREI